MMLGNLPVRLLQNRHSAQIPPAGVLSVTACLRQLTYTGEMQAGPENVQFFFGHQVVGYFEDQPPSCAGEYRYMPFRGPGHYRLGSVGQGWHSERSCVCYGDFCAPG
jgi:hypothetical protein